MNTSNIKSYAPKARTDFIAAVQKQAVRYGVTEEEIHPVVVTGDVAVVNGKPFPAAIAPKIRKLAKHVEDHGYQQTMEQVAYSWFNRLVAIRYMELHDYLGHGRRVLSHPDHATSFQILEECTDITYGEGGQLPNLKHEKVVELKLDGTKDEELYRELLLAQCHALHKAMPFLFENIDDETELLLPENLTKTDSLIHELVNGIPEQDWQEVEIIGWLYQFYISEKKDQVIGKVVKSEDIPAATQLFTPNWIVKYMVQNSLGAQWLATYPNSPLKAEMEYYIEPAEQTDEVKAQLAAITPSTLNPEEITLIDPASGSGHILVEAYELFKDIYLERGYRKRDVPQLILEKNLFGLDIDVRAAQLTGFALMMKGRADDRQLFERGVKLNVMALGDSMAFDEDAVISGVDLTQYGLQPEDLTELKLLFEHAETFGSLIQVPQGVAEKLPAFKQVSGATSQDLFTSGALKRLGSLVQQVGLLAAQYDAVVANPPYMGSKAMNSNLKDFASQYFPNSKSDLFAVSMERYWEFAKVTGFVGLMTPFTWMFLKSYESLRGRLLNDKTLHSLIQPQYHTFFASAAVPVCTFTLRNFRAPGYVASFINLSAFRGADLQPQKTLEAIGQRDCGWFFETAPDELKKVPGGRIAYWASPKFLNMFESAGMVGPRAVKGLDTGGNIDMFLRRWFEPSSKSVSCISPEEPTWYPLAKGGKFRRWYGNHEFVINYADEGRDLKTNRANLRSKDKYFQAGLTWTVVTIADFAVRILPEGFLFDQAGSAIFFEAGDVSSRIDLLASLNSCVTVAAAAMLSPTISATVGDIREYPALDRGRTWPDTKQLIFISKFDWDAYESSWDFQSLPILTASSKLSPTLESSYTSWITQNRETIVEMKQLEEENNLLFIDAYGLSKELTPEVPIEKITLTINPAYRYGVKLTDKEQWARFRQDTIYELISYSIGCMMGRYSLNAPGLIYANKGNENFDSSKYITFSADEDGIIPLTKQEWFKDDATNRFREFISVAWAEENLQENLDFVAESLCLHTMKPKNGETSLETIRRYLCTQFYKDHLKTYKKRPIYWLFSSGKLKAFECLVYLHRYNEGTLARMRTEYVIPLTAKLNSHVEKLEQDKIHSDSAAEIKKIEKEIATLHKQQAELTTFDEKLKHAADQRIKLDLDDGVKVNYGKFGDLLADVKTVHGKTPEKL